MKLTVLKNGIHLYALKYPIVIYLVNAVFRSLIALKPYHRPAFVIKPFRVGKHVPLTQ